MAAESVAKGKDVSREGEPIICAKAQGKRVCLYTHLPSHANRRILAKREASGWKLKHISKSRVVFYD